MTGRLCFHCGEEATVRLVYAAPARAFDQRPRATWVCGRHVQDELDELRHLGFDPQVR